MNNKHLQIDLHSMTLKVELLERNRRVPLPEREKGRGSTIEVGTARKIVTTCLCPNARSISANALL